MRLQTMKLQRLPVNHEKLGEELGADFPSHPADTLISDF